MSTTSSTKLRDFPVNYFAGYRGRPKVNRVSPTWFVPGFEGEIGELDLADVFGVIAITPGNPIVRLDLPDGWIGYHRAGSQHIRYELKQTSLYGIPGVIIHTPDFNWAGKEQGFKRIFNQLLGLTYFPLFANPKPRPYSPLIEGEANLRSQKFLGALKQDLNPPVAVVMGPSTPWDVACATALCVMLISDKQRVYLLDDADDPQMIYDRGIRKIHFFGEVEDNPWWELSQKEFAVQLGWPRRYAAEKSETFGRKYAKDTATMLERCQHLQQDMSDFGTVLQKIGHAYWATKLVHCPLWHKAGRLLERQCIPVTSLKIPTDDDLMQL